MTLRATIAAVVGVGLLVALPLLGRAPAQEGESRAEGDAGRTPEQGRVIENLRNELEQARRELREERAARAAAEDRLAVLEAGAARRPARGWVRVGGPDALVSIEIPEASRALREAAGMARGRGDRDDDRPGDRDRDRAEDDQAPGDVEVAEARVAAARARLEAAEANGGAEAQAAEAHARVTEARARLVEAEADLARSRRQAAADDGAHVAHGGHRVAIDEAFETAERVIDLIRRFREDDPAR